MPKENRVEKFNILSEAQSILELLNKYIDMSIQEPKKTEKKFWVLTCLPKTSSARNLQPEYWQKPVLVRISMANQEVLGVGKDYVYFFCAKSPFNGEFTFVKPGCQKHDYIHKSGGANQICIITDGIDNAMSLLDDPVIKGALNLFTKNLMEKSCAYSQYHSSEFAEQVLNFAFKAES